MSGNKRSPHALLSAVACLALVADLSAAALAQEPAAPSRTRAKRSQAKRSVAKTTPRPKGGNASDTAADRITLRDGKELLGQVVESSNDGLLTILARREMVRKTLPSWATKWEDAEKHVNAIAVKQRRERLAGWRWNARTWRWREIGLPPGLIVNSPGLLKQSRHRASW